MLSALSSDLQGAVAEATEFVRRASPDRHEGVLGLLFDEPSTRTRFSTASAAARVGLTPVIADDLRVTSLAKREPIPDTAAVLSCYFDVIGVRSRLSGLPALINHYASVPVVNLGDGTNEHPTQALATMVSCALRFGGLAGRRMAIWGDLELGRVAHSVFLAAAQMGMNVTLVPALGYDLPSAYLELVETVGARPEVTIAPSLDAVTPPVDVLYVTREQWERRGQEPSGRYPELSPDDLKGSELVLHPLPRGRELGEAAWGQVRPDMLRHVEVTYKVRQWVVLNRLTRAEWLMADVPVQELDQARCRFSECAGNVYLPPDESNWLVRRVGSRRLCTWCLRDV